MRGLTIDPYTATEINTMVIKGAGEVEAWKSIETPEQNYKMKYDINSSIPKGWDVGHLGKLLSNIKHQIFNIILTNVEYMIECHTFLRKAHNARRRKFLH